MAIIVGAPESFQEKVQKVFGLVDGKIAFPVDGIVDVNKFIPEISSGKILVDFQNNMTVYKTTDALSREVQSKVISLLGELNGEYVRSKDTTLSLIPFTSYRWGRVE